MAGKDNRQAFVYEGLSDDEVNAFQANSQEKNAPAPEDVQPEPANTDDGDAQAQQQTSGADAQPQPSAQEQPRMVDVRALQEARAAQRAAEQKAAAYEQERIRIDERLKVINEALAGNQPQQPNAPSFEEDPIGNFNHRFQEQQKVIDALSEQLKQRSTADVQAQNRQAIIDRAGMTIDMSRMSNPDVDEALNFTNNAIKTEIAQNLQQQGYFGPQFAVAFKQVYDNAITQLAQNCPADPDQAAEHVRRHARFYGWHGVQQPQQVTQPQQPLQQAQQAQPQLTPQQRQEQQNRHMSLSGTQGGQPPAQLSAKSLAEMSDEEFFALKKSVDGRKKISSIQAGN
jgi:hypothetical protein